MLLLSKIFLKISVTITTFIKKTINILIILPIRRIIFIINFILIKPIKFILKKIENILVSIVSNLLFSSKKISGKKKIGQSTD